MVLRNVGRGLRAQVTIPGLTRKGLGAVDRLSISEQTSLGRGYVVASVAFFGRSRIGTVLPTGGVDVDFLEYVRNQIQLRVLPVLRANTPRRTGRTADGYRVVITKNEVQIVNLNPLTPVINSRSPGRSIPEIAQSTLDLHLPSILEASGEYE